MYRYIVDNAITYTSEDFVLFRESPFACWMERLTLENPDHGIPPDVGSLPPRDSIERQDDMADTLRAEGKDVCLVDWDADEPSRRSATLAAMRKGVDFIVNGQLALGPLSGAANLLVRTSGYSELGDFLYIPCETQARTTPYSAFRLCFLADLLHSLQGQLPPQMLVIRGGDDLVPLQTESHIYHYRAVKQRFMETMRGFRKHRMPDPAESAHFGRWSDCAHEVLKQRLLREEYPGEDTSGEGYVEPRRQAVAAAESGGANLYDLDDVTRADDNRADAAVAFGSQAAADAGGSPQDTSAAVGSTLAEQARMLKPGTYKPGPGVYRLGPPRAPASGPATAVIHTRVDERAAPAVAQDTSSDEPPQPTEPTPAETPRYNRRASDAALQNLEFIGSTPPPPGIGLGTAGPTAPSPLAGTAPAPSLRDPRTRAAGGESFAPVAAPDRVLGHSASWGVFPEEPEEDLPAPFSPMSPAEPVRPEAPATARSSIDLDGTHLASPPPGLATSLVQMPADFEFEEEIEHRFGQAASDKRQPLPASPLGEGSFSDSLITSDDFDT